MSYRAEMEAGSLESAKAAQAEREKAERKKKKVVKKRSYAEGTQQYRAELEAGSLESAKAAQTPTPTTSPALNVEKAKEAIKQAESLQDSGGRVQWGDRTYDLGTTQGWRDYRQALRDARSELSEYNRRVREWRLSLIGSRTPEPATARLSGQPTEVGPPKQATETDLRRLRAEGYDLPTDRTIYIGPDGEPFYYEVSDEYIRSIGPPEPTAEQRRRMEAGMPISGLPGPANVSPPGSITARIQPRVQRLFEKTSGFMEKPFKSVTDPIRGTAGLFGEKSIEAAQKGKPLLGLGFYAAEKALDIGALGFDIATFELRPGLWVDVARSTTTLAVSPAARAAYAREVARDPFGFTVETVGGVWLGGRLKQVPGELELGFKTLKAQRGSVTEGLYGPSVKKPTWSEFLHEWRAIRDTRYKSSYAAAKTDLTELKFMEESGFTEIPQPIIVQRKGIRGFEELKITDTTSNLKFDALPDSVKPVSTGFEPYKPPKGSYPSGAYDQRLWSTGAELELISVPPGTPLMPVYKPIPSVEIAPSYIPGIRYRWMDLPATQPKINIMDLGKAAVLSTKDITGSRTESLAKTRVKLRQAEKQASRQFERAVPTLDSKSIPVGSTNVEPVEPVQTPIDIQIQKQTQKQVQRQTDILIQKTVPVEEKPIEKTPPTIFPPGKPSKAKTIPRIFDTQQRRKVQAVDIFGATKYKYRVPQAKDIIGTTRRGKAQPIKVFNEEPMPDIFGSKKKKRKKMPKIF